MTMSFRNNDEFRDVYDGDRAAGSSSGGRRGGNRSFHNDNESSEEEDGLYTRPGYVPSEVLNLDNENSRKKKRDDDKLRLRMEYEEILKTPEIRNMGAVQAPENTYSDYFQNLTIINHLHWPMGHAILKDLEMTLLWRKETKVVILLSILVKLARERGLFLIRIESEPGKDDCFQLVFHLDSRLYAKVLCKSVGEIDPKFKDLWNKFNPVKGKYTEGNTVRDYVTRTEHMTKYNAKKLKQMDISNEEVIFEEIEYEMDKEDFRAHELCIYNGEQECVILDWKVQEADGDKYL